MKGIIVNKYVALGAGGLGRCPFCNVHALRGGRNTEGQLFYHCFSCGVGGTAAAVDAKETK